MKHKDKFIAMTDLETSGDIFSVHEILELGLVIFDPKTFEIKDTFQSKIKPLHIENAVPEALKYNGYNERDWQDASDLMSVMKMYGEKTKNCVFCSYNVSFDWGFISESFAKCSLENPMSTRENHDRLDLLSIAWLKGLKDAESFSLKNACKIFGVLPESEPHSALNGAMTGYNLFKKLLS